tara:strand:+ start:941 stop:1225 length:285 start_codon:yes stop_codon:yes gene_type:complete
MNFLILIFLIITPWIICNLKFVKNSPLVTLIMSCSISYYWFHISWWPIVVPILISLFIIYNVNPTNNSAQEAIHSQVGLIIGCVVGVIASFFIN